MPAKRSPARQTQAKFTKTGEPAPVSHQVAADLATLGTKEAAEARTAFNKAAKQPVHYYLESPLAQAPEHVRQQPGSVKIALPIHPGPTVDRLTGKPADREAGDVILFEGRGATTEQLFAEYICEQWRGLISITKVENGIVTGEIIYKGDKAKHVTASGKEVLPQEVQYYDQVSNLAGIVDAARAAQQQQQQPKAVGSPN